MDLKWKQHFTLDLPAVRHGSVWVHACSVGEVASVVPIIERLLAANQHVHLTVVTRTGRAHAARLFGDRIHCSWLPWDLPFLMARFVQHLQPSLLLLCETEFWPGMFKACKRQHIPIIGINTRISDRSFPKYRATRWFWSRVLAPVSLFLAQSQVDAQRLAAMGIPTANIQSVGNLKFAVQMPQVDAQQVRQRVDPSLQRPILIVASTHDGEEAQVLDCLARWTQQCPNLLTLIVPRHPERFDDVAALLQQQGIRFSRYASGISGDESVILVDAMGVLTELYTVADLVFIGGSLVPIGGHNPLEAAVCGRGVITGQYTQNFREMMLAMQQHGAAIVVQDKDELELAVLRLLQHEDELKELHAQAALFMQEQQQVLDAMWHIIQPRL